MPKPLAEVYHLDLFGLRKDKYQTQLDNSISSLPWNKIDCRAPNYFFIAKDFSSIEDYGCCIHPITGKPTKSS